MPSSFLTGGVFMFHLAHRRSVAVLCMLYKIRCNLMYHLYCDLPEPNVPARVTRGAVIAHRHTYSVLLGTESVLLAAELLFPCQCLCGTILVSPYSMVRDWRVSRAAPKPFCWPICSVPFCLLLFSLSLLSFYGLVLWGRGLRTDRVLIALS